MLILFFPRTRITVLLSGVKEVIFLASVQCGKNTLSHRLYQRQLCLELKENEKQYIILPVSDDTIIQTRQEQNKVFPEMMT